MTTTVGSELAELLPLALVITLSPLSVIPAVLVLRAPRPRPSSLAFLGGWLIGLATITAAFVGVSGLLGGLHRSPPAWASYLRIVVGTALIVFGIYRWLTRRAHTDMPAWMRSLTGMTPARAGVTAAVLAVLRPEVLFMCAAAGLSVGGNGLRGAGAWTSAAFFVAVAASSVAAPVLAYLAAGHRLDDALERLDRWLEQHNAALVVGILVVIGVMVAYNGIHAL